MSSLKSLIPSEIHTARLLLHSFDYSPAHYECFIKTLNCKSTHAMMGDMGIRTPKDLDKLISTGNLQPSAFTGKDVIPDTRIIYIIQEGHGRDGPLIGMITLPQRTPAFPPDLGWAIQDAFQRQGYAPEAAKAVLDMLQTQTGMKHIMVWPGTTNQPSISVAKKIGFVEGPKQKDKAGNDVLVYVLPGMQMDGGMVLSLRGDA